MTDAVRRARLMFREPEGHNSGFVAAAVRPDYSNKVRSVRSQALSASVIPAGALFEAIEAYQPELIAIRHDLHAHPELGYEEVRTAGIVERHLRSYGVDEIHTGIGRTGVVGVIRGHGVASQRAVGLRADMDALPIREENTFDHHSRHLGKMHGCGHDGHTTMLLGAARYLAGTRNFNGTACLFFQPGEEGHAGAQAMIEDGLFERFPVDAVYALHNWPSLPAGTVGLNAGPMMAGIDRFTMRVVGTGGHGGQPHQTIDPILVTAHIVSAIQSIVSKNVDPLDSGVIGLHYVKAGEPTALSVVPEAVDLAGMIKWYRKPVQEILERRLREVAENCAAMFGARVEFNFDPLYPPTINTAAEAETVARVSERLLGKQNVLRNVEPSMSSEDFAFMLLQRPGAYFRLGTGGQRPLHNPNYDFNDSVIPLGAAIFAAIVEESLGNS